MALWLSVGVSKKIGRPAFSSIGASCQPEVELEAGLLRDPAGFRDQVRSTFLATRQAIDDELARLQAQAGIAEIHGAEDRHGPRDDGHAGVGVLAGNGVHASNGSPAPRPGVHRARAGKPATTGQVRAIVSIARRQRADLDGLLCDRGIIRPEELSLADASKLIDQLKAAGEARACPTRTHHLRSQPPPEEDHHARPDCHGEISLARPDRHPNRESRRADQGPPSGPVRPHRTRGHAHALASLGLADAHAELEAIKAEELTLARRKKQAHKAMIATLRSMPIDEVTDSFSIRHGSELPLPHEVAEAVAMRQASHREQMPADDPIGREIAHLEAEKDNLLDTIWLAASPAQIKQLWAKAAEQLGDEPTALEREALAFEAPKEA